MALSTHSSSLMRSLSARCCGDTPRPVWMRGRLAHERASAARSMSLSTARVSPTTTASSPASRPISWTERKSPGLEMGKPASMTSTCMRRSCWATMSFSSVFMEAPGDCSPSRRVVSKMSILRVMGRAPLVCVACAMRRPPFRRAPQGDPHQEGAPTVPQEAGHGTRATRKGCPTETFALVTSAVVTFALVTSALAWPLAPQRPPHASSRDP